MDYTWKWGCIQDAGAKIRKGGREKAVLNRHPPAPSLVAASGSW
jgi:hypothetical protein